MDIGEAREDAIVLGSFKAFCSSHSKPEERQRVRNILERSSNEIATTVSMFNDIQLDEHQSAFMLRLIHAFLNKSPYRKPIDESVKRGLLMDQNNRCAICGCEIDIHDHADHKVPFKYVGDALEDNLQMLCARCNEKKNASIDFQIRYLLKMV